ncbi:bifunctional 3-demethylubiquinone-9 3-methyltransferase/ 2-octaprenyl-6-hydroxy phenol methylase [Pedobacter glucosidilyticus]|nr:class I SAM-dependent methyltransferase [Pedobacter glucosidilyticus]KHJ36980.1 bifunctional 3-demethylubiquinone-9 3-methyltransferase/ 2-octaprenyl-6-hydroxy phenol methylase [Pedobacter glucosidilyticus]
MLDKIIENKEKGIINYNAINYDVIPYIPSDTKHILDVGCGSGDLAHYLSDKYIFDGITYSIDEGEKAKTFLRNTYVLNLNILSEIDNLTSSYDCIICSHILEHLYEPWLLVKTLEKLLKPNGVLIIAIPNILFYKQRIKFLTGKFEYSLNGGLMDITHYRFFDYYSVDILLKDTSLKLLKKEGVGIIPLGPIRKIWKKGFKQIENYIVSKFPNLFSFQIIISLRKD